MGARVDREVILAVLRLRYDYYSAESVLTAALERAGLAGATSFDPAQLRALRGAIERVGDRLTRVLAEFDALGDASPAVAAPAAAAPVIEPAPAPPVIEPAPPVTAAAVVPPTAAVVPPTVADAPEPAPPSPLDADTAAVTIAVTGVEVDDGCEVLVCGSAPALGAWDPVGAARLEPVGDVWTATIAVAPDAELAFKFLHRRPDGELVWEPGANRVAPARGRIDATWRSA